MLKVIIVNNEANLSVEKGSGENTLKFTIFKDAITPEILSVEVNRDELDRVIGFVNLVIKSDTSHDNSE